MPGHKVSMTSLHWQTNLQTQKGHAHCMLGKTGCVDFLHSELRDLCLLRGPYIRPLLAFLTVTSHQLTKTSLNFYSLKSKQSMRQQMPFANDNEEHYHKT